MKIFLTIAIALCMAVSCGTEQKQEIEYVDPLVGTGFHGHTYPGATLPFGAVQLSPDTRRGNWDACSGYHYSDSTIIGFSHTHLSGTGCIDLGDILFRPTTADIDLDNEGYIFQPVTFSHDREVAVPGYYSVVLENEKIKAELTATTYAGMHRYTYPEGKQSRIIIDMEHMLDNEYIYEAELQKTAGNEITGMRRTRGWVDNQYVYFVVQFSQPFSDIKFINDRKIVTADGIVKGQRLQAVADFGQQKEVIAKVGISAVSAENARKNLENDIKDFDFNAVRNAAYSTWKDRLSAIEVEGGSEKQLKNFYTALYHTMVVPNIASDINGEYRRQDMTTGHMPQGRKMYSTFSTWDTFRAWHPLMTILDTTLVNDMVNSLLNMYDASGELPVWPLSAGETGTMIGYHSASIIADAYMKGIRGFDAEKALEAMVVSSEKNKKGADYYIKYGYIPSNIKKESISCLLEFAYDDWTIAQMAKAMGREDVYNTYISRSQNYINVFDGGTRFFRGKRLDGNWEGNFNPFEVGRDYTEATAWQYRFFVPHDVNGMIQLFGGMQQFTAALDSLFTVSSEIEGELSDITGLIGQYAHGNEPSHHMAYLYSYTDQPWKTQAMTRRLLDEMYAPTPEGIIGNEDCGQMSAWYVLSSLGFYPVCPGSNEYVLTAPAFRKAVLKLANGKTLEILANNPEKNIYIKKVSLNGKALEKNFVTHSQLMEGGTLQFELTDKPYASETMSEASLPYSCTKGRMVSIPYVDRDLDLFLDSIEVKIASATADCDIHYTLDGSEPDQSSPEYSRPLVLKKTATIKAKAFKDGFAPSRTMTIQATRAELAAPVRNAGVKNGTSYTYIEGEFQKVADLAKGKIMEKGVMARPSIGNAASEDHFGYIFEGFISVPEDGVYTFGTRSDDGSVLYVAGQKVVDNDGSHAAISATGRIALRKGLHPYRLMYFEDYEGQYLDWEWKLPSSDIMEVIPESNIFVK